MGKGTHEIERRYLARVEEGLWDRLGPGVPLRQGYLTSGSPAVRIRTGEARGPVLTCKTGAGVRRREVEAVVHPEMAEVLFLAAGDRVLEKVRHALGPWELDRFEGSLTGLVLLEIELSHEKDTVPPPPSGVSILREVTDDNAFTNSHLACMANDDRARFVSALSGGGQP